MDYSDDLGQEAKDALRELGDDTLSFVTPAATELSPETSDILQTLTRTKKSTKKVKRAISRMDYLFKFDDPITPTILASAAILSSQPMIVEGENEDGGLMTFWHVDELDVCVVRDWLAKNYPAFQPSFTRINVARKALSPFSAYPTLGLDTTLPQHQSQGTWCPYLGI